MKEYKGLFKMTFKGEIQYKIKAFSGIITQLFWGIMYVYLYTAFMGGNVIEGFSLPQMASYVWLGQAFFVLRYVDLPKRCANEIESGDVCYKFTRPIDLYNQWYFEHLGYKISATLLRCPIVIIVALLLPSKIGLMAPVSISAFLLFVLSLAMGGLMMSAISMIVVFLTFKTNSSKGTSSIVNTICGIFGGLFIPLPLMPNALQNVINYLPFRYIVDLPIRIYIGNMSISSALMFIGIALAWLVFLIVLGKILISKAVKNTVIQGG